MKRLVSVGLVVGLLVGLVLMGGCYDEAGALDWTATLTNLGFFALIGVMFYFLLIRPQRKRQKQHAQLMSELQRGDRVIIAGGIYGVIDSVGEDTVVVKVESGSLRVQRGAVVQKLEG